MKKKKIRVQLEITGKLPTLPALELSAINLPGISPEASAEMRAAIGKALPPVLIKVVMP